MVKKTAKPKIRKAALGQEQLQAVAEMFSVLSEQSRLNILQILQRGPSCVGDLVMESGMKQANVSRQLAILLGAGLIARRQDGNRAIYSIEMPMVFDLCDVICSSMAEKAAHRAQTWIKK